MLVNNIINIINEVWSMTTYIFVQFIFRFTDIYLYHMTDYICCLSVNIQVTGCFCLNSEDGDSTFLQIYTEPQKKRRNKLQNHRHLFWNTINIK